MSQCNKLDCWNVAAGAVGVAVYPALKTDKYLTKMVLGLVVCQACLDLIKVEDLMPKDKLEPLLKMIENAAQVKVNHDACKIILVAFDDPDYLKMLAQHEDEVDG